MHDFCTFKQHPEQFLYGNTNCNAMLVVLPLRVPDDYISVFTHKTYLTESNYYCTVESHSY